MTEGRAADAEDEFERLLLGADDDEAGNDPGLGERGSRSGRLLPLSIGLCALLGVGMIGVGLMWDGLLPGSAVASAGATSAGAESAGGAAASASRIESERSGGVADSGGGSAATPPGRTIVAADPAWVARVSGSSGIPERALAAYASAALSVGRERPWCGIGWNTLAAIGHVESEHGSMHGAAIGADGVVSPRVIGVALDGTRFEAVPDTDGGSLDGDAQWDRAVGPMQFLPQTWSIYGRDGNGDGRAEIDQIDDAAFTAAELLCSVGGDLRVPENWVAAVHAYNPSIDYNNEVAEAADYYAAFS